MDTEFSQTVMTVLGPVPRDTLGVTLMHEHILNDCRCWWRGHEPDFSSDILDVPITPEILSQLRHDPFANRENCALDDEDLAVRELMLFAAEGGATIVDPTCKGIGRDPEALTRIARKTGLNIIMGAGYYLHTSHPDYLSGMSEADITDELIHEARVGIGPDQTKIGLIGEIGVSSDFTTAERKVLAASATAAASTGLPLMVHLPGWFRLAHDVLDLVERSGLPTDRVILCHMNPSGKDLAYQRSLADRGAFLEYDMIGMDFWYADQAVQCPSDEENAAAIVNLFDLGYGNHILLSQDVFIKMMLCAYGGNGYAHVQRHFLPRLLRHGLTEGDLLKLMVDNPRHALARKITTGQTT
ncbi:TatD family hydrolase [Loktanella sp. TSTF-M6]|uniref:TatD family hydrolase n=1 Tax=Loktanella gaetbuli TaxID=2881335 RepID=A0ABS8BXM3_9RHOB|nr:TatD family hydrolase [Loktanella gaetbuli]MCB5200483.1 TatD family hydrolase [Loktanella gaetbuli]